MAESLFERQQKRHAAAREAVERGMALLDKERPGWMILVYTDQLEMASGRYCILGQVCGSYSDGIEELDLTEPGRPEHFGFTAEGDNSYELEVDFLLLQEEWSRALEERLNV